MCGNARGMRGNACECMGVLNPIKSNPQASKHPTATVEVPISHRHRPAISPDA
jgi:hypothetical protein